MRRQTYIFLLLAIVLAFGLYLFFGRFFVQGVPDYANNIAAAVMGSLITVIITMVLLNRQSEAELLKERNVRMLEEKIKAYDSLMSEVKEVLEKGTVQTPDVVAIQVINQRLSFVAGPEVLREFNAFAKEFSRAAADGLITDGERHKLLRILGELSVRIRYDLASQDDIRREQARFSEKQLLAFVRDNVSDLSIKTTESAFLDACSDEDRAYFGTLFTLLRESVIKYWMGTKGFSVSKVVACYPTQGSRLRGVQVRLNQVPESLRSDVLGRLEQAAGRANPGRMAGLRISLTPQELPVEALHDLVKFLVVERGLVGEEIGAIEREEEQ